jgi:ribosomal protein S18 acetylase RimI-like enzyme
MTPPMVRALTADDEARAVDTVVLAFAADPVVRWTWSEAHPYLTAMPRFLRAFGGRAFATGGALGTSDYAGVALWLPPGVEPDQDALSDIMLRTVAPSRRDDVFAVIERMATHHPHEPHWYLPLIGVDPAYQGHGYGDALMSAAVARCDRDRVLAYLESTNPRNIPLYLRHGFEAVATIQVGTSPPLVPMLRRPRML